MSDEEYEVPLQDQRVFGAGLKRKRVHFVPSTSSSTVINSVQPLADSTSVGDRYLNLVLSKSSAERKGDQDATFLLGEESSPIAKTSAHICEICSLPISPDNTRSTRQHEATLAHQVCLKHSHPPSHLDRSRLGLRYLQSQGWDPDSGLGLGAKGQGIQFPIKAKRKDDKLGLGLVLPDKKGVTFKTEVREKLDAGKLRKLQEKDRKKTERLQELFYRSEDLDRHLGTI